MTKVKSRKGTDPRNPHPTKKVKRPGVKETATGSRPEMTPLERYVYDSYCLAKRMIAGYIVRSAKKKAKIKMNQSLFNSRSNRDIVSELTERFEAALTEEIRKVAGWEK